jgi:hypothetical protein
MVTAGKIVRRSRRPFAPKTVSMKKYISGILLKIAATTAIASTIDEDVQQMVNISTATMGELLSCSTLLGSDLYSKEGERLYLALFRWLPKMGYKADPEFLMDKVKLRVEVIRGVMNKKWCDDSYEASSIWQRTMKRMLTDKR